MSFPSESEKETYGRPCGDSGVRQAIPLWLARILSDTTALIDRNEVQRIFQEGLGRHWDPLPVDAFLQAEPCLRCAGRSAGSVPSWRWPPERIQSAA